MSATEPIAFLNGALVPESQAGIPIRDRGFIYGDAVFDAARTFNGVPFKLAEHVKRLYDSLRYVRIDPGIGMDEMEEWSRKVVEHNYPLLPPGQDMWVMQRVTRGVEGAESAPTVLIETHAIPFVSRAPLYRDGARVTTPSVPRVPPRFMSPRAKTHNYLNLVLGDLEAQGTDPGSWAVLLDEAGNLTEGRGLQHFPGEGRGGRHAQGPVRAGGHHAPNRAGPGRRPGSGNGGARPGPVRRIYRRRGVPDFHQPVHLSRLLGERRGGRRREAARAGHAAVDAGIQRPGGDGFRGTVFVASKGVMGTPPPPYQVRGRL